MIESFTMQLAQRLQRISEPQTIKMAKLARALKADGKDIIDLSLGEPDFNTPNHICEAATAAMTAGFTKYTPVAGIPELRQAICNKLWRDNQLSFQPDEVMVSTGAKHAIANVVLSLVDPGDEVVIPTPYWVTYSALVEFAEGIVRYVPCGIDTDFKLTPDQLAAALSHQTKLFIFSSPCNPTGSVYTQEELAALAEVFEQYPNVYIISDEIYEYINYIGHHASIASIAALRDRVIVVNGMSKGFAMTGWRIGYIAAPKPIVQACEQIQAQFTSGTNSIAQRASVVALTGDLSPTLAMTAAFKERRDYVVPTLRQMPGLKVNMPAGAFYAFPDVRAFYGKSAGNHHIENDEDLSMYLLHHACVTTVNGSAFGSPECIRISFAASMELLEQAMNRIGQALAVLR